MKITSLFFVLCFPLFAFSNIESHLKLAENKADIHSMENVDFIYMINLDERPEKLELSNQQLNPYGIYPYRFSAVNGWNLTIEAINEVGLKYTPSMDGEFLATSYDSNLEQVHGIIQNIGQTYFCHCMARGTIGIALSHLSVLHDALLSNYETIWVMEDDIEVLSDPTKISALIHKLDEFVGKDNWDVLFTDRNIRDAEGNEIPARGHARRPNFKPEFPNQYLVYNQVNEDFIRTGARFGAHSMIIRKSGMKKIYDFIVKHSIFLPYDLDFYLPAGIKLYSVTNDVVSNLPKAISDNGGPLYLKKKPAN